MSTSIDQANMHYVGFIDTCLQAGIEKSAADRLYKNAFFGVIGNGIRNVRNGARAFQAAGRLGLGLAKGDQVMRTAGNVAKGMRGMVGVKGSVQAAREAAGQARAAQRAATNSRMLAGFKKNTPNIKVRRPLPKKQVARNKAPGGNVSGNSSVNPLTGRPEPVGNVQAIRSLRSQGVEGLARGTSQQASAVRDVPATTALTTYNPDAASGRRFSVRRPQVGARRPVGAPTGNATANANAEAMRARAQADFRRRMQDAERLAGPGVVQQPAAGAGEEMASAVFDGVPEAGNYMSWLSQHPGMAMTAAGVGTGLVGFGLGRATADRG